MMALHNDFAAARLNMVEGQIRPNKVTDQRLIDAFSTVPREAFAPKALHGVCYVDSDLPLGQGRMLMQPMVLARLLQAAAIDPRDIVLDVGTASGYSLAIIGKLASAVIGLESNPDLAKRANEAVQGQAVDNAVVVHGPLDQGWNKQASYNVIILQGAAAEPPEALSRQLAEGGRLVGVFSGSNGQGHAKLFLKTGGALASRILFDAALPFLPGLEPKPIFAF
jgi:protein-L-isoaspartate(D-aspartate) O-methyltransferase